MAYIKREGIPVLDGELAVELDTGALVAVVCERKRVDAGLCYHARARAIDEDGMPHRDSAGRAVQTEFKHSISVDKVAEYGDENVTREMLLAVLGEPVSLFPWPDVVLAGVSIRVSIAAAHVSGTADAGAVL